MTALSPRLGLTIPNADGSDPANLAALLRSLGLDVENKAPGVTAMTNAARVALSGDAKFSGRVVWCTDTATLHVCDGTNWWPIVRLTSDGRLAAGVSELDAGMFSATAPVMDGSAAVGSSLKPARSDHRHPSDTSRLPLAGGTMSGPIAMGGNKVTGLGAASANGDAVRYEQALLRAGGTMTGKITLDGNPSAALHAVPRQWVDPVYGIGTVGAGQSLTAGQWNTISGWTAVQSQSMVFTTITFPIAGVWVVTSHVAVQYSASPNEKHIARLVLNGSATVAQAADFPVASLFDACMALSAVVNVASADTVGLSVYNGGPATRYLRDARLAATLIARS